MLLQLINTNPILLLVFIAIFIASITLHEFGHAAVADILGDPTPREAGRVTLNPVVHLSFFGTLLLVLAGFGWAKPVPVTPSKMRWPRLGNFLVSAAGPFTNFVLALIGLLVLTHWSTMSPGAEMWFQVLFKLNVMLMILNLLPIPPLDGGHILESMLPRKWLPVYEHMMPYGMILLLLLAFWPFSAHKPLSWLFGWAEYAMAVVFTPL